MAVINPSNCRKLEEQIQYGCTILMFKVGERTITLFENSFALFFFFLKFMEYDAHLILEFIKFWLGLREAISNEQEPYFKQRIYL